MKMIGSFFGLLLFSLSAFTTAYSGAGVWKSVSGTSGEYNVATTIDVGADNTVTIDETLTFDNEALKLHFVLQKIDDTFFNVLNQNGEKIGDGYCWSLEPQVGEMICHTESRIDGYTVESTIKKTADAIFRFGSKTSIDNNEKIVWKDTLYVQVDGQ